MMQWLLLSYISFSKGNQVHVRPFEFIMNPYLCLSYT